MNRAHQPRAHQLRALQLLALPVLALCLQPLTAAAQKPKPTADVLTFTNGDQLTGKLESASGGHVVFKSDMAGEVTIPFARIRELKSSTGFVEIAKGERVLRSAPPVVGSITLADGTVTVTPPSGPPASIPADKVAYLVDGASYHKELTHNSSILHGWTGAVTGGATVVRSTQAATTLTGALALVRSVPTAPYLPARNRTMLNISESYGKQSSPVIPPTLPATPAVVVKTNIFHADAERDEYLDPRLFALGDTTFDHNFSQGLNLQQVYGAGLGYTVLRSPKQTFDVKADAHYERQSFLASTPSAPPTASISLFGSTFSEDYTRNLPHKLVFNETASYLPAWTVSSAYSANVTAGLILPVFKRLSASVTAMDSYLNDPAPFYNKNSVQFVTGLSYSLR